MSKLMLLIVFTVSTLSTVVSQTSLKYGLNQLKIESFSLSAIPSIALKFSLNVYVWGFFIFALIAMFLWIWGLAYCDLSFAYPFLNFGYILVVLASAVFLHESITLMRWIGVFLVTGGMFFIYKS